MHHPDYSAPLHVYWLCRPHHLDWHTCEKESPAVTFSAWLPPNARPAKLYPSENVSHEITGVMHAEFHRKQKSA